MHILYKELFYIEIDCGCMYSSYILYRCYVDIYIYIETHVHIYPIL